MFNSNMNAEPPSFLPGFSISATTSPGYVFPPPASRVGPINIANGNHMSQGRGILHVPWRNVNPRSDVPVLDVMRSGNSGPRPPMFCPGGSAMPGDQNPRCLFPVGDPMMVNMNFQGPFVPPPFNGCNISPQETFPPRHNNTNPTQRNTRNIPGLCKPTMDRRSTDISETDNFNNKESDKKKQGNHWCEACERNFNNLNDLKAHQRTHVKCEFIGCNFIASRKVVSLHFIQTHAEGKFRIRLLTAEDIEKWRSDRRKKQCGVFATAANTGHLGKCATKKCQLMLREDVKINKVWALHVDENRMLQTKATDFRNYPTAANIKKKREEAVAKRKAGVVLDTTEYRYLNESVRDRNGKVTMSRRFKRRYNDTSDSYHNGQIEKSHINKRVAEDSVKGGKSNQHTNDMLENQACSSITDNGTETGKTMDLSSSANQVNGLLSIGMNYGSDDSEDEDTEKNSASKVTAAETHSSKDDSESAAVGLFTNNTKQMHTRHGKQGKREERVDRRSVRTSKPTLLEMLLAKDIRHERNLIFQCVRHIVKSNFFEET